MAWQTNTRHRQAGTFVEHLVCTQEVAPQLSKGSSMESTAKFQAFQGVVRPLLSQRASASVPSPLLIFFFPPPNPSLWTPSRRSSRPKAPQTFTQTPSTQSSRPSRPRAFRDFTAAYPPSSSAPPPPSFKYLKSAVLSKTKQTHLEPIQSVICVVYSFGRKWVLSSLSS